MSGGIDGEIGGSGEGEGEIWGTWEELLLASAVSRHGTRRWDSVAMEVQSRIPASAAHLLTPLRCRQRFHLLQNRFSTTVVADGEPDDGPLPDIPWLEELRKLRVAELRREVERSDLSIRNLQVKVERLRGERDRIAGEAEHGGGGEADLKSGEGRKGSGGSTPEAVAGDRISGRSCKESNSTDPKENGRRPEGDAENAKDTTRDGKRKTDPVAGERSDDRSSAAGDLDPADRRESGESAAESKGGEAEERERDGEKECSEVQSSASLTRRRRMGRRRKAPSVSSSGAAEPEADVVSPHGTRVPSTASQPLVSFLEMIRSSKPGSVFARRLDSQKTGKYKSLIRRHVDLEMIGKRIERSGGACGNSELFRDLLLLCNNAIVFYAKGSDEAVAAVHLRDLISKEMAAAKQKPAQAPPPPLVPPEPAAETTTAPAPQPAAKLKEDPVLVRSLLEKSTSAAPLITCRKRSSISAKKADPDRKEEKEEKPDPDRKERDADQDPIHKKKTKERSSFPPARGFRTNKTRSLPKNPYTDTAPNLNDQVAEADSTPKGEKKNTPNAGSSASLSKKRSATSFLKRMKRSSPSNGTLLETLKSSGAAASGGGKATDQKKPGKGEGRKEQSSKSGATAKQTPEPSAPTKRSVGRPPKRGSAPPSKRAREEAEGSKPTPPARKRGRR